MDDSTRADPQRAGHLHPWAPPSTLTRLGANAVALLSILAGKALVAVGLRAAPEGWRRTVGVLLRSESTRFALSAFGLRVPDERAGEDLETRIARGLAAFLSTEPDAHFALAWQAPVTSRQPIPFVDVVVLVFAPGGTLREIVPVLGAAGPPAPAREIQRQVHAAVIASYNATAGMPETVRGLRLPRATSKALRTGATAAARAYAARLLAAACLSFEETDRGNPAQRFQPPSFATRRTLGLGYLSWIARADAVSGSVDLWVSAHHVGLDGVPLQDMLNRLEAQWGVAAPALFPDPTPRAAFAGPAACHAPGERPVDLLLTFADLSPVVALRRVLTARHGRAVGGDVTLGTLLAWLVSRQPEFRGVRIASTVDVAASAGYDRDVDVVSLRAADFATGEGPWDGFVEYAREFNRLLAAARTRTSPVRAGMQTAGLMPAWAHAALVRSDPGRLDETFGTLCITIIRDASVFVAPMTDLGLGHGFFAIGRAGLPSESGTSVASVTVKGDAGRIVHYPDVLDRVLAHASRLLGSLLDDRTCPSP